MVEPVPTLAVPPAESPVQVPNTSQPNLAKSTDAPVPTSSHPNPRSEQIAQTIVLAMLFAGPALMCVHAASASDPDIWWHLRTGQWILQHHAIPRIDPYSAPLAGKPWQPYSWLFELLVSKLFQSFSLVGVTAYTAALIVAITVAFRHLVSRLQSDFSVVILLTFAACYSLGHLFTPRPWLFTILFFVLEVDILMHVRRTGRTRELLWLPLIFAAWANIHIQFIDGLIVLGLALAESVASHWGIGEKTSLRIPSAVAALVASVLATMANPFGWHIYRVAYDLAAQSGVLDKISELQAIRFRDPSDYVLLFLALAATAGLARSRRLRLFELGLLLFAAVVSFRSQRDVWVMATAAAAIIASTVDGRTPTVRLPKLASTLAITAAVLAIWVGFRVMHVSEDKLQDKLANVMPVHAVQAIRANHYDGPLYNDFNWGGYLIDALRMPVSIDGRAAFYGDDAINRSIATWNAEPDWNSDPALTSAGVVIGPAKAPLTQLLRLDPHFQLVYEDKLAAVFIARRTSPR